MGLDLTGRGLIERPPAPFRGVFWAFSIPPFGHLEKFAKWSVLPKITQNRAGGASQRLRPVRFNPPTAGEVWVESDGSGPQ